MKLRNILMTGKMVMFAGADRTGVVGYTAGDYRYSYFPQSSWSKLLTADVDVLI